MALDAKFNAFKVKHGLGDEAMAEMLSIFNDSFIELAHKLLQSNDTPIQTPKPTSKTTKQVSDKKKFATKIAAEYAAENDLTLDDFDKEKVTKKDIDEHMKTNKSSKSVPKLDTTPIVKETKQTLCKEKCNGINKSGEPCNRPGTEKPDGSSKCFCFRHAMDWKVYEISSDSDLEEEEEIFNDLNEKIDIPDLAISTEN